MTEPLGLKRVWVDAIHFQQLLRFGGLYGVRDDGVIDSALARPLNRSTAGPMRTSQIWLRWLPPMAMA